MKYCEKRAMELGKNAEHSVVVWGGKQGPWPLLRDAAEPCRAVPGNVLGLKCT